MTNPSNKQKTYSGLKWNFYNKILVHGSVIVITIVLSRILSPREFGLVTMVNVVLGFFYVFQDFSLSSAIIQKKEIDYKITSTVFWLNLMVGSVLTLLIYLGAPIIADFYNEPILEALTTYMSLLFFIGSLSLVQTSLFTRDLNFKALFYTRLIAVLSAGAIAIYLATNGYGVWSLVAQALIYNAVSCVSLWIISDWKPSILWDKGSLKSLFDFSVPLFANQSLNYWVRNIDKLLIGKALGSASLGFYNKGYSLMLMPVKHFTKSISEVMFPSLSRMNEDKEAVRNVFLKMVRLVALFTFPALMGLGVLSESFVIGLLGDAWSNTIPILEILIWVGLIQSVSSLYANLYLSQGATKLQFKVGLFLKIQTIAWIVFGLQYGIVGVASCYLIAVCINQIPHLWFAGGLVDIGMMAYLRNLLPIIVSAILMMCAVYILDRYVFIIYGHLLRLILGILIGTISYICLIHFTRLKAYTEAQQMLKQIFKAA